MLFDFQENNQLLKAKHQSGKRLTAFTAFLVVLLDMIMHSDCYEHDDEYCQVTSLIW